VAERCRAPAFALFAEPQKILHRAMSLFVLLFFRFAIGRRTRSPAIAGIECVCTNPTALAIRLYVNLTTSKGQKSASPSREFGDQLSAPRACAYRRAACSVRKNNARSNQNSAARRRDVDNAGR
jgi:hypothetical protein